MSIALNLKNINEAAQKDILELQRRIEAFKSGKEDEERFKHYRLTRGVYGQRQLGVQMFRIKIPIGRLTSEQLIRIADVSEKYATGNLHLTTRQDIQYHYVKLENSPKVWIELAEKQITAREACGNTVRNVTASPDAGIHPDEPFDVSPYAQATAEYFLRNPICQEMGRKVKISFSSNEADSAFGYFHDFGMIPKIKIENGKEKRGFKVFVAGGLGAQAMQAYVAHEFLPEEKLLPFIEAGIRVFDRFGEREKRFKARMKFLLKTWGFEKWFATVNEELKGLENQEIWIDRQRFSTIDLPQSISLPNIEIDDQTAYDFWYKTNVLKQKQVDFVAVKIKVQLGDIHADKARLFAAIVKRFAADDIRVTVNQGFLLRYVRPAHLPYLYKALDAIGLASPGFDTLADVTACPGTDTCNLAVTNSTGLSTRIEEVVLKEYPSLILNDDIKIKISGCMNACGQHTAANIGFHGSSIKKKPLVVPAMQLLLGGGINPDGSGSIADKVIKLPTKRILDALRNILDDYNSNKTTKEHFNAYYRRQGKRYFYTLLKPLADISTLSKTDFFDWNQDHDYHQEIGVGECAGVAYDVVGTIIQDAHERLNWAKENQAAGKFGDSTYHAYSAFVIGAKALLLSIDVKCNTHIKILGDFDTHFVEKGLFQFENGFTPTVLTFKKQQPDEAFNHDYVARASQFLTNVLAFRNTQLGKGTEDKLVVDQYYKA